MEQLSMCHIESFDFITRVMEEFIIHEDYPSSGMSAIKPLSRKHIRSYLLTCYGTIRQIRALPVLSNTCYQRLAGQLQQIFYCSQSFVLQGVQFQFTWSTQSSVHTDESII